MQNSVIIVSDNGLSPIWPQAITWTNDDILFIGSFGNKIQLNFNQNVNIFIQENAFENAVCKIVGHFVSASLW